MQRLLFYIRADTLHQVHSPLAYTLGHLLLSANTLHPKNSAKSYLDPKTQTALYLINEHFDYADKEGGKHLNIEANIYAQHLNTVTEQIVNSVQDHEKKIWIIDRPYYCETRKKQYIEMIYTLSSKIILLDFFNYAILIFDPSLRYPVIRYLLPVSAKPWKKYIL